MKTKPKLDNALRQRVFDNSFGMCINCKGRATEAHHVISKTLLNIKLYGIERIDSIENLIPVCHGCHGCHDRHSLWDGELRRELREKWSATIESKIINKLVSI